MTTTAMPPRDTDMLPCAVISVGVPRSGTSLLSRILNDSPDLAIIDDLYYLQTVDRLDSFDEVIPDRMCRLRDHLMETLRERTSRGPDREFKRSLLLSDQSIEQIETALNYGIAAGDNWTTLLRRFMSATAIAEGKRAWGYNTPQDYLHLHRLAEAFPEAKFIFQMRDPRKVLQSYKNIWQSKITANRSVTNDPRRYNPIVQSLHWKTSAKAYLYWHKLATSRTLLLRYEDLSQHTREVVARLDNFLDVRIPIPDLAKLGSNAALTDSDFCEVTPTELKIAELVLGKTAAELGYAMEGSCFRFVDLLELVRVMSTSCHYYASTLLSSPDMRKRLARGLQYLLKDGSSPAP